MKLGIANVEHLCCFTKDSGSVMGMQQFERMYGYEPLGINAYYGINETNLDYFKARGKTSALTGTKKRFFESVIQSILNSEAKSKYIVIGMEPTGEGNYAFVHNNLDLLKRLAMDINEFQNRSELKAHQKSLKVSIRYASEMNDKPTPKTPYAGIPGEYKRSFIEVREIFKDHAPNVEFAFSPAIRADIYKKQRNGEIPNISEYWPGDSNVDIIGGTWYTGKNEDDYYSNRLYNEYVGFAGGKNKPLGLDELGGRDIADPYRMDGGLQLLEMMEFVENTKLHYNYVTVFMEAKWKLVSLLPMIKKYTQ